MSSLIEIIPSFEIQLGRDIDPDLFSQVKNLENQRNLFLKKEISFEDYCDAVAISCDIDDYLDEVSDRLDYANNLRIF
ncbi:MULTISPECIES: hypothetical protein [unclassified Microcystis]|jgi:hypothetical protein|uniref:hypothetical protein n=1 Tax=unclassified Microcystis TaxID=2643300 RepID=UPI0022C3266D|nr:MULTISPECIES: hypothetical protein [unclassified Microcystis]MCA2691533.1 hypothetical protein [Microcystis sp. M034S2]MCA2751893.1 hypothetical protein [Microcystis sp. M144S2]MCZ8201382.1 hypothetical protein [Microcystis sp. LE19-55.1A]MCZ8305677.1 hypothetical protein [Microcystis sp. LE19-98.1E]